MDESQHLALLQGGLANQLLQGALIASTEGCLLDDLRISDCLLSSRSRAIRLVTQRSLSSIFPQERYKISRTRSLQLRIQLRCDLSKEILYGGGLIRIKSRGQRIYKGDGFAPEIFCDRYNAFWFSVLDRLDAMFGASLQPPDLAIHIRWGDYKYPKTKSFAGLYPLPRQYYLDGLNFFSKESLDSQLISIFTDSPSEVKEAFSTVKERIFNISQGTSPEYDLWSLTYSKCIVISNSSFSCIAAHLSSLRNGKVRIVAPKKWFLDGYNSGRHDLRKTGWDLL